MTPITQHPYLSFAVFVATLFSIAVFVAVWRGNAKSVRRRPGRISRTGSLLTLALAGVLLNACAGTSFTTTANMIAQDASITAKAIGNTQASNYLYALAAVAQAYGKAPVPTNIATATAPISPALVAAVLPLITGANNGPKTQALINGAAAILANTP